MEPINILLVEDNPGDARIVKILLEERKEADTTLILAESLGQAMNELSNQSIDLVLLDLGLPDAQHFSGLATIREQYAALPIVVLTGTDDTALGIDALYNGAQDYLSKSNIDTYLLYRSIRYSVERARIKQAQIVSELQFTSAFQSAAAGMAILDLDGKFTRVNSALCQILGHPEESLLQANILDFSDPEMEASLIENLDQMYKGELEQHLSEYFFIAAYDIRVYALLSASLIRDVSGEPVHLVLQFIDMTQRKEAEIQLLQAQKLEAVGQLTGGIAHDFNNLLAIIMGNLEMLELSQNIQDDDRRRLTSALDATNRGAELVARLLSFARKQPLAPVPTEINERIEGMKELLTLSLGETIEIEIKANSTSGSILIDPSQLETSILNLAVNARDAMPHGGRFVIESSNITIDENSSQEDQDELPAGNYAVISVSDTGTGIPESILESVLQPFFTTKEIGEGSGLGLSMVFGFMKQSGGRITIDSLEDTGTTINLYFPLNELDSNSKSICEEIKTSVVEQGNETILVVEDDVMVRDIVVKQLNSLGYKTIEAGTAVSGLEVIMQQGDKIDLLFSDIKLPGGMSGVELSKRVRESHPQIAILQTSGFSEELVGREYEEHQQAVLTKPYSRGELSRRIRTAIKEKEGL